MTLEAFCSGELLATLRVFPPPRRIVTLESAASADLRQLFPRATVRDGAPDSSAEWAGPDLLWFGVGLSAAGLDAPAIVRSAWQALPDGAMVVALDPVARESRPDPGAIMRGCFAILATVEPELPWWPLRAYLGAKTIDREW